MGLRRAVGLGSGRLIMNHGLLRLPPQAHASTEPAADESQTSSQSGQGAEPAPERGAEPDVIGRYSSGGSDFTLYSDGSIDAQTEHGLFRFESMAELRAHIEAQNEQG